MNIGRTLRLLLGRIGGRFLVVSVILMFNGCIQVAQNNSNASTGNGLPQSIDTKAYRFPANAASQIRQHIQCKGTMLMIPVALANWPRENKVAVLENPVEIAFPFDALPSFTGYQYVVQGYSWTVGPNGLLLAFLLIGADGNLYYMDTPDAPFGEDMDIRFYKAQISQEWKEAFDACRQEGGWEGTSGVWQIPNGTQAYRWRDSGKALPILERFSSVHSMTVSSATGKWEPVKRPCFTPNVYCEGGLHQMPPFNAQQVLLLHPTIKVKNVGTDFSYEEKELTFPNGKIAEHIAGMKRELDRLWKTGQYRILVYDRRAEKNLKDPERDNPWAPELRKYAADKGIPLVVLYGEDTDAPEHPGLPNGVRQFWQCPQCVREQMK